MNLDRQPATEQVRFRFRAWVYAVAAAAWVIAIGQYFHIEALNQRLANQGDVLALLHTELQHIEKLRAEIEVLKKKDQRHRIVEYIRHAAPHQPAKRIAKAVLIWAPYYDLEPELLVAVYRVESRFNPHAISETNARGIAQIVKSTADFHGMPWHQWRNIETSVRYGAEHLRWQLDRSDGNVWTALGRYNGWSDKDYQLKVLAIRAKLATR